MPKPSKVGYTPSYPHLVVDFKDGKSNSCLRATKTFKAGDHVAPLELGKLTKGPKAYTSVQCGPGPNDHIELNSDLVYINHSCDANVAFDLSSSDPSEWHIRSLRRVELGEAVTCFYPSTEWDMNQPFECECRANGYIRGAKYLSLSQLAAQRWINPYILKLVAERDGSLSYAGHLE